MKRTFFSVLLWTSLVNPNVFFAQDGHKNNVPLPENVSIDVQWQHADLEDDGKVGISAKKAYQLVLNDKKPQPVVVAVIDSGTETWHPDLFPNIWVNKDEIPGNNIDDDKNGYIDDVHGWSFIGGKTEDVAEDNLEFTRVYKTLRNRFKGKDPASVSKSDQADFKQYQAMEKDMEARLKRAKEQKDEFNQFFALYTMADNAFKKALSKEKYTLEEVQAYEAKDEMMSGMKEVMIIVMSNNLVEDFPEWRKQVENQTKYAYNLDFDPRYMVGDNYNDPRERNYGNNRINGPHAEHGTHVAGIIGAERGNGGMDGVCSNCELMIIRCVPDGDERDKDVANAIRYAADNGARVINMSFGKSYSPFKEVVDEAVKYAESKGVLLVHAAGNDSKDIDKASNFPTRRYNDGSECSTWLEIGASGPARDELLADFSNYGRKSVDVFAPGVSIYSTMTNDTFKAQDGTSMASPVAAGAAATLMAYFPELTAKDVKAILLKSAVPYKKLKFTHPANDKKKIAFGQCSRTGAVINLYQAVKIAETWKPGSAK
jgi:subtilisin family serine protease